LEIYNWEFMRCSLLLGRTHLREPVLLILLLLLDFQLFGHLFGALLDALHPQLLVTVALLEIAHGQQHWVLRLLLSLLHFFKKLGVQHLEGGHADASIVQSRRVTE